MPITVPGLTSIGDVQAYLSGPVDSPSEAQCRAEGFLAQTCPRQSVSAASITTTGSLRLISLFLRRGLVFSTAWIGVGVNATGVTLAKIGIWKADGTLLAVTADMSAVLNAGGAPRGQSAALTAPWAVPLDGPYYAGILQVGGTTAQVGCAATTTSACAFAVASAPWPMAQLTGLADVAAFNPASLAGSALAPWIGFS